MHSRNQNKAKINRRKFIHQTGLALGASALAPLLPVFDSSWTGSGEKSYNRKIKIGLLLPASFIYPEMADNFIAGINTFLCNKNHEKNVTLLMQQTGYGSAAVTAKSEMLINEEKIDILAGIVSESVPGSLRSLLEDKRMYMIANHVGANIVRSHDHNPFIIHNSLNLWQSNYALGMWAAENLGKRALVVSSFYESGYDAQYAFNAGFESAQGKIIHTTITNLPSEMSATYRITDEIEKYQPDLVFASYSGQEAVEFVRIFKSSAKNHQIPLLGSAFTVDENILPHHEAAAEGIFSCMSWNPASSTPEFQNFASAYREITGKTPDSFAIMGYETAALIEHAYTRSSGHDTSLHIDGCTGPRGRFTRNKDTHMPEYPLYINKTSYCNNKLKNIPVRQINPVSPVKPIYADLKTGWLNPYLCA